MLVGTYTAIQEQVQVLDAEIARRAKADPAARRLNPRCWPDRRDRDHRARAGTRGHSGWARLRRLARADAAPEIQWGQTGTRCGIEARRAEHSASAHLGASAVIRWAVRRDRDMLRERSKHFTSIDLLAPWNFAPASVRVADGPPHRIRDMGGQRLPSTPSPRDREAGKKESTVHHHSQACPSCVISSSLASLAPGFAAVRTAASGSARRSTVTSSACAHRDAGSRGQPAAGARRRAGPAPSKVRAPTGRMDDDASSVRSRVREACR